MPGRSTTYCIRVDSYLAMYMPILYTVYREVLAAVLI
eukprot:UN14762